VMFVTLSKTAGQSLYWFKNNYRLSLGAYI